ncbi:MAG: hypothetical protein AMK69_23010 [Nitrospira bacterium SG8_3]|nr:MAG: hypothetical protein AMK69_23010 [Nitrospira bacterium SG8_3]
MIRNRLICGILLTFMISWISVFQVFAADLELTERKQLSLDVSPLDIAASADGQWLFILTPGEIIVYSAFEDKISKGIPIDKGFDRLTHSARDNALILSSRSEKAVKIIQLELIHQFDNSGLPVKGPENAPVTVAVFGDYQ